MKLSKLLKSSLIFMLLLILWDIFSKIVNPLFLPKPDSVFNSFKILFNNGMLFESCFKSIYRIMIAIMFSCLISIPLALLVYSSKTLNEIITPLSNALRFVPVTAFNPLLILWIGIGEKMKIMFLFCATFFYFLPSIVLCINEIDDRLIETGLTMGMSKLQVLLKIVIPYTLPSICQNILMMIGIGFSYIVVAEATNTNKGLGYLINIGSARGKTDLVFVSIITIMLISFIIDFIGNKLIQHFFTWKFKKEEI